MAEQNFFLLFSANFALLARFFFVLVLLSALVFPLMRDFLDLRLKDLWIKIYLFLKDQQILCKKSALENAFLSMKSLPFLAQCFSKEKIQQQNMTRHLSSKS